MAQLMNKVHLQMINNDAYKLKTTEMLTRYFNKYYAYLKKTCFSAGPDFLWIVKIQGSLLLIQMYIFAVSLIDKYENKYLPITNNSF